MNYAICYVSTANTNWADSEINQLLQQSKQNYNRNNIQGLLLYSEGNFFQIIEGDKDRILNLYESIENDTRHSNLIKVFEQDIEQELFDGYESDSVSEDTRYKRENIEYYLNYIHKLDPRKQKAVQNILKAFLYSR